MAKMSTLAALGIIITMMFVAAGTVQASTHCWRAWKQSEFPNCVLVSPIYALHWSVIPIGTEVHISFAMDVDGTQWRWIGVGLREMGGMRGADELIVRKGSDGSWTAGDYFSVENGQPDYDDHQDVQLVSLNEEKGYTSIVVRRRLDTCDETQDIAVQPASEHTVIWAMSTVYNLGYHGSNRGMIRAVLYPNTTAQAAAGSGANGTAVQPPVMQQMSMLMPNFTVPSNATTYECVNLPFPNDTKYHIYTYEPIIASPLVHHILAYACTTTTRPSGSMYDCMSDMDCETPLLLWAPGMGNVTLPSVAGLPFGNSSYQYLTLQIHYNNVDGVQGTVDNSGFRIYYSSTLRESDVGVMTLGSMSFSIPPNRPTYSLPPSVCPSACTRQLPGNLTVIGAFLHMHQLGLRMVTRHVRNGTELPPLGERNYFSFEYQGLSPISPYTKTIMPGDELVTTCTYDSSDVNVATPFGPASYQEMCYTFVMYYPATPVGSWCLPIPDAQVTTCTTMDNLNTLNLRNATTNATQAGWLVPYVANITYKPYDAAAACWALTKPSGNHGGNDGNGGEEASEWSKIVTVTVICVIAAGLLGLIIYTAHKHAMHKKFEHEQLSLLHSTQGKGGGGGGGHGTEDSTALIAAENGTHSHHGSVSNGASDTVPLGFGGMGNGNGSPAGSYGAASKTAGGGAGGGSASKVQAEPPPQLDAAGQRLDAGLLAAAELGVQGAGMEDSPSWRRVGGPTGASAAASASPQGISINFGDPHLAGSGGYGASNPTRSQFGSSGGQHP